MALLEICCYSMECALTAQRNGADRIELCAAPKEGGLTPSLGVLRSVREHITIPVHPIIRPRGGDFYYTDGEFAAMLEDIRLVRELAESIEPPRKRPPRTPEEREQPISGALWGGVGVMTLAILAGAFW
ncbi:hypothetical protein MJH59_07725, partial [Salmonella enterica subsp. enterica serovar Kentucky]|nr:hypothetical protein [Salmonella enterica subsp. enterica serovar Kentucky]